MKRLLAAGFLPGLMLGLYWGTPDGPDVLLGATVLIISGVLAVSALMAPDRPDEPGDDSD